MEKYKIYNRLRTLLSQIKIDEATKREHQAAIVQIDDDLEFEKNELDHWKKQLNTLPWESVKECWKCPHGRGDDCDILCNNPMSPYFGKRMNDYNHLMEEKPECFI